MPSTVLAVDDSVTMRKVLEITFAGPEFRIVTASSPDAALQKLKSDKPDVVIADISLEPRNGYELCKAIKQAAPGTAVLILSSKQNPFDAAKGGAAQADDHMDKPFDTQQMIDKVKKLLTSRPEVKAAAAVAPAPVAATPAPAAPAAAASPAARAPVMTPVPGAAASPLQRAKTLIYTAGAPAAPGAPVAATPAPSPAAPGAPVAKTVNLGATPVAPTPATGMPRPAAPAAAAAFAAAGANNGQLTAKLEGLGLTPAQVEAVTALSREIVERVVWEVVPVLAETIIKEEIARLTK